MFETDENDRALIAQGLAPDPGRAPPRVGRDRRARPCRSHAPRPAPGAWMQSGGRRGVHSEHLGHLLAVMQHLPRAYPGARW
jgi:ring-1,2-phenylacetyl-CoA epoxidase subunit PaaC